MNASIQQAVISNAGKVLYLGIQTITNRCSGLICKCFEIPHYSYRRPLWSISFMQKINLLIFILSVTVLANCSTVKRTKSGYKVKGKISQTTLINQNLNGKSKISGLVYSKKDSTYLSSANIIVNKNSGTTSNQSGEFQLELSPGSYKIEASYIGHDNLTIPEIKLQPNHHAILIFQLGTTVQY